PLSSALEAQISGIAGASKVSILSTCAHAFLRAAGSVTAAAFSIAALIFGLFSDAQFTLFTGTIAFPLNGVYRYEYASGKSGIQPAVGHTLMCAFTTPQNFEYIVCCGTGLICVLKPRACRPAWTIAIS